MYFEIIWLTILQLFDREAGNTHRVLNFKILTENTLMSNQQSTSATVIPFLEQFHFFISPTFTNFDPNIDNDSNEIMNLIMRLGKYK